MGDGIAVAVLDESDAVWIVGHADHLLVLAVVLAQGAALGVVNDAHSGLRARVDDLGQVVGVIRLCIGIGPRLVQHIRIVGQVSVGVVESHFAASVVAYPSKFSLLVEEIQITLVAWVRDAAQQSVGIRVDEGMFQRVAPGVQLTIAVEDVSRSGSRRPVYTR